MGNEKQVKLWPEIGPRELAAIATEAAEYRDTDAWIPVGLDTTLDNLSSPGGEPLSPEDEEELFDNLKYISGYNLYDKSTVFQQAYRSLEAIRKGREEDREAQQSFRQIFKDHALSDQAIDVIIRALDQIRSALKPPVLAGVVADVLVGKPVLIFKRDMPRSDLEELDHRLNDVLAREGDLNDLDATIALTHSLVVHLKPESGKIISDLLPELEKIRGDVARLGGEQISKPAISPPIHADKPPQFSSAFLSGLLENPQRLTDPILDELGRSTFQEIVGPNRYLNIGATDSGGKIGVGAIRRNNGLFHHLEIIKGPHGFRDDLLNLHGEVEEDHFHAQVDLDHDLQHGDLRSVHFADRRRAAQTYWQWIAEFCGEIGVNLLIFSDKSSLDRIRDTLPESMEIEDSQTNQGKPALLWRNPEGAFSHHVNIVGAEYLVLGEIANLVHQILFPRQQEPGKAPETNTYEHKHVELMQLAARNNRSAQQTVKRIAVLGVGLSEDGKVYEPFEWLKLFPEATLDAYDRNRDALDQLAQSDLGREGKIIGHQRDFVSSSPLITPGQKYDIISCLYVLEYLPAHYRDLFTIILLSHLNEQGCLYFEDQDGKFLPKLSANMLTALGIEVMDWWTPAPQYGWRAQKQYVRLQKVRSSGVLDRLAQRVLRSAKGPLQERLLDHEAGKTQSVRGTPQKKAPSGETPPKDSKDDPKASFDGSMSFGGSSNFQVYSGIEVHQAEVEFVVGDAEVFDDHTAQVKLDYDLFGDSATQSAIPNDWETTVLESIAQAERKGLTEVVHYLEFASDKEVMDLFADETQLSRNLIENGYAELASQLSRSDQKLSDHQILQINAAIISGAPNEVVRLVETIVPEVSPTTLPENEMMILGTSPNGVMRSTLVLRVVR